MLKYFDTHSHIVDTFDERGISVEEHIKSAREASVTHILDPGIQPSDFVRRYEMLKNYDGILMGVAFGPHNVNDANISEMDLMESIIEKYKPAAISEIGLDYQVNEDNKNLQHEILARQLELAKKYGLPVFLHIRRLYKEVSEIIKKYALEKVVVHCFTGNVEEAKLFLDQGCILSFPGVVTFNNAKDLKEAAVYCPLDKMVAETDSPYLAPVPHRGRPNQSAYLPLVVKMLADLRGEKDFEAFVSKLYQNSFSIFEKKTAQ